MSRWRLIESGPLPGALNMALDAALLELHALGESPPTLRLYQWEPAALSLGYFQRRCGLDTAACRRLGIDVVRRPTGGRAVLHLHDLTYSLVAGLPEGLPSSPAAAYRLICSGLLAGLRLLGVEAEPGREPLKPPQPEVCFLRLAACDLSHGGRKFAGSAQTWRGSSLLQHGSIVLSSQAEPLAAVFGGGEGLLSSLEARTTSLEDILGRPVGAAELAAALRQGMAAVLGIEFEPGGLSEEELALARQRIERGAAQQKETCPGTTTPASGWAAFRSAW